MTFNKLLIVALCYYVNNLGAQAPPPNERIENLKIAFITKELGLTKQEAQKFWPIYNAHEIQLKQELQKERNFLSPKNNIIALSSDAEAVQLLAQFEQIRENTHRLHQQLLSDLVNVIPAKKVLLLIRAEEEFKRRLLRQMRDNKRP